MTDDIIKGFTNWCYRFVVTRRSRKNPENIDMNTFCVIDGPADAYYVFTQLNDVKNVKEDEEWILVDAFGKNAIEFCKQQEEKYGPGQQEYKEI
jgi:hypothetical protein